MSLADFEALLKRTMGLDVASVGPSVIAGAVQKRLELCRSRDTQTYWQYLLSSTAELQELVEAVIVPETWFLRDREPFTALVNVLTLWLSSHPIGEFRILSLPCSTGEEPYSIAMACLDAGLSLERVRIVGLDISEHAIERARRANYGRNSFRGTDFGFRDRYFHPVGSDWQLSDTVRKHVEFRKANLFDPDVLPISETYDIIFCRNLLIYFDVEGQDRAIHILLRHLNEEGLLFVGPSETGLLLRHDLVPAKLPLAFAFRKGSGRADGPRTAAPRRKMSPARPQAKPVERKRPHVKPKASSAGAVPATLEEVELLANKGDLLAAAALCEAYLRENGPSAHALHFLGVIHGASGDYVAAAENYRKALYLDPEHRESLIHLTFLLDKQGDTRASRVLRERMRRLEQKAAR